MYTKANPPTIKKAAPVISKTTSQTDFDAWFDLFLAENSEILDELANR